MRKEFHKLNVGDQQILIDAFPLITILVGSADGNLDPKEITWAKKVTKLRVFTTTSDDLQTFYKKLDLQFYDKLVEMINGLPASNTERTALVVSQLAAVNGVLAKVETVFAKALYKDFLSFSKHVAKAKGGIFQMGSISPMEKAWLGLDMISCPAETGI